jgi:thioredoxin reductase
MKLVLTLLLLVCPALALLATDRYQVVVIGGGPAGLSCATECARAGYQTMLLDASQEGIHTYPLPITNWPGFPSANWPTAINTLQLAYGRVGGLLTRTRALSIKRNFGDFQITTQNGAFRANVVVMATGRRPCPVDFEITPTEPGRILSRLWDESFLKQTDVVVVIGPGSLATDSAIRAAQRAKQVYLFRQPLVLPTDPLEETTMLQFPKIHRMYASKVTGIIEAQRTATVEYTEYGSKLVLNATWVILAREWLPNSESAYPLVPCDSTRAIIVQGPGGLTAVPGLFACGEVCSTQPLLGVLSSAEGVRTAQSVCSFLIAQKVLPKPRLGESKAPPSEETPPQGSGVTTQLPEEGG